MQGRGAVAGWSEAGRRRRWGSVAMTVMLLLSVVLTEVPVGVAEAQEARARRRVIVSLPAGVDVGRVLRRNDIRPSYRYTRVINGFAAEVSPATARVLEAIPGALVTPDLAVRKSGQEAVEEKQQVAAERRRRRRRRPPVRPPTPAPQVLPTGVNRIDADLNPLAAIARDGTTAAASEVGIAVLDTGIFPHRDLNVRPGKACIGTTGTTDLDGHGTHVAGTAAAIDNTLGVVGVSPGSPVYPVKVLGDDGGGTYGSIICGLDWVVANRATVDVVNMSLGGTDPRPTTCATDAFHRAVCNVVGAGIPVVVAAGNEASPADSSAPAKFDEAITVSAFADSNGVAGGGGAPTCAGNGDDAFSRSYSNFDPDVDIAAPGDCIASTFPGDTYRVLTGTSMASPHVAGAVALYIGANPDATPAQVRDWLLTEASVPQTDPSYGFAGDVDAQPEPALYVGEAPAP